MIWRRQPPVLSPVSVRSLIRGAATAIGLRSACRVAAAEALRKKYRALDVLLTDSGTSALTLALKKLAPRGGIVALPGYGCIDLTAAALAAGVGVRLYDINPATLSPDLDSVHRTINRGIDVIVVTHLYGYPANITEVMKAAAAEGIAVIEDAAQGAGGTFLGERLGSIGDVAILSFGRGKGITAGSGGALLARTPGLAAWINQERAELAAGTRGGMSMLALAGQRVFSHPLLYGIPASVPALGLGAMEYHEAGRPREIAAAAAAVLPYALDMDAAEIARRRTRASKLCALSTNARDLSQVRVLTGGQSGYLRFPVIESSGAREVRPDLGAVRGYPKTLDQHDELQPILLRGERGGSGSRLLRDKLFTLPTHSRVDERCLAGLADWMAGVSIPQRVLAAVS